MIVILTLLSLFLGLSCGIFHIDNALIAFISQNTDYILYLLMFSVGISVGMHRGILKNMRKYNFRIFVIPIGIIVGSILGGFICSIILKLPIRYGSAIASGMGWYSLAGATISNLVNADLGSIAFMSNLMREIFTFILIPYLAIKLNHYTCIASAGATSEDTTLPMILKYTDEEVVVLSVLNGIICSFFVPILISLFLA